MLHTFQSVDEFLFSIEKEVIDTLYDYNLLIKLERNVKKIIFYFFVKRLSDKLNANNDLLFYHDTHLSDDHELFTHFDKEKLTVFINKICQKLKKVTNRIFFHKKKITLPSQALTNELEGSVIDEVLLLGIRKPVDAKELKDFLDKNHLKDLFNNLSKKVC
jgi:hypothetical protein